MKDGFELCPAYGGAFLFKKFLSSGCRNLSLPPLKQRGIMLLKRQRRRPVRLRARTPPFHGGDTSSNLVRATKNVLS